MILLAGFAYAGVTLLQAQEGPSPAPAVEPAPPAAAPAPATTETAAAPSSESADPPVGPTPNRFEPTEKVRADFDVSFPIDI